MKKRRTPKRVHPKTMIASFKEIFKDNPIKKTTVRTLLLTVVAVSVAKTFRINEVASHLPILVENEKSKQKRLLRFLKTPFPIDLAKRAWAGFIVRTLWDAKAYKHPLILVDETDLPGGFKAIVASLPFRHRAIPIYWIVYSNTEITDGVYKSHNEIVQTFCTETYKIACAGLPQRAYRPVLVFDRGFARAKYVIEYLKTEGIDFVLRVCRNASVSTEAGWQRVGEVEPGSHTDILYHKTHRIRCHLFVIRDESFKDPMLLISNLHTGAALHCVYKRRMQIEHGFRDLKSTFGFGALVVRKREKSRVELLFLCVILAYGLCFVCYEGSADRWARSRTTGKQKPFSVIRVIKDVLEAEWSPQKLGEWFAGVVSPGFSIP